MGLADTIAAQLGSDEQPSFRVSTPRRVLGQTASGSPLAQNIFLSAGELLARGDAFWFESINAFLAPSAAVTITDMSLSLANNAGNILALLGQPVITTLSPASETSLYFPVPAMVTFEDLLQWSQLSTIPLTQPFNLRLRLAWTAPATSISLRTQCKFRFVHGLQEG